VVREFADLSHYEPSVTLSVYANAGFDRVFLKATDGLSFSDPTFAARWQVAGELGLARGAYHFARAANNGAAEFDHFLSVVEAAGGLGPRDVAVLDSEDPDAPGRAAAHAAEFTRQAVARGVPAGLVYTGVWYGDPAGLRPEVLAPGWRRLWLSDYHAIPDAAMRLPAGWSRDQVYARQYTSSADLPGIPHACDASRVLREWIALTSPSEWTAADKQVVKDLLHSEIAAAMAARYDTAGETPRELLARQAGRDKAVAAAVEGIAGRIEAAGVDVPTLAAAILDGLVARLVKPVS
jgi:hypothetical protein